MMPPPRHAAPAASLRREHRRALLLALLAGGVASASPALAQIRGEVLDPGGAPATGARVELWNAQRRVAVRQTDALGRFEFSAAERDSASTAIVTLGGYEPRSISLARLGETASIRLDPTVLAGLVVQPRSRPLCPNVEDPEARALWAAAAGRYSLADTLQLQSLAVWVQEEVAGPERRSVDESRRRPGASGSRAGTSPISPETGYGFRIERSFDPLYAAWRYERMGVNTERFIEPDFGRYTSLSFRRLAGDRAVLTFCSRNLEHGAVGIEGTLTLNADTTLHSATWTFRTPEPREEAGGEVLFVPHEGGSARPWLVPYVSTYWRRLHGTQDRYIRRWSRYVRWQAYTPRLLTLESQANWQDW